MKKTALLAGKRVHFAPIPGIAEYEREIQGGGREDTLYGLLLLRCEYLLQKNPKAKPSELSEFLSQAGLLQARESILVNEWIDEFGGLSSDSLLDHLRSTGPVTNQEMERRKKTGDWGEAGAKKRAASAKRKANSSKGQRTASVESPSKPKIVDLTDKTKPLTCTLCRKDDIKWGAKICSACRAEITYTEKKSTDGQEWLIVVFALIFAIPLMLGLAAILWILSLFGVEWSPGDGVLYLICGLAIVPAFWMHHRATETQTVYRRTKVEFHRPGTTAGVIFGPPDE